jgi:hypothetical protein
VDHIQKTMLALCTDFVTLHALVLRLIPIVERSGSRIEHPVKQQAREQQRYEPIRQYKYP